MQIPVHIVHAFVDGSRGGNPAGVVLDADNLTTAQKLKIAASVGRSETAFVSASTLADFKLEFFTPAKQIAHCGHATIAAFAYLKSRGKITSSSSSKETVDGTRDIYLEQDTVYMEQRAPSYVDISADVDGVLDSLQLYQGDLIEGVVPSIVNTGNAFLILPLATERAVSRAKPRMDAIVRFSEKYDLIGYYLFSKDTRLPGRDAGTRMFAPRYGIDEESATGMAAGPLAGFLFDKLKMQKDQFVIEQGHLMEPSSPSRITVKLDIAAGRILKLMAGGKAKVMESIYIEI